MIPRLFPTVVLLALSSMASAQVVNGSFETGSLTGWTRGGTNSSAVISQANVTGPITVPDGTYVAAISTGPDNTNGAVFNYDNLGGNNDYDFSSLSQTLNFTFSPAFIAFDWAFSSSEQNEADQYDDLADVTIDGTRIFSRSSCKNNGTLYSPFPNAACNGATVVTTRITGPAPLTNVEVRYGVPGFQRVCLQIPNTVVGANTKVLRFGTGDQNDHNVDSTFFIDNVELKTSCNETASITQLTTSSGGIVEQKGQNNYVERLANARASVATDDSGINYAFISNANLLGTNPNFLDQVYSWNGTAFARANLTVPYDGQVQSVAMSGGPLTSPGRYVAIAVRMTANGNTEIYRWDRSGTAAPTQITNTSAASCNNTNPSMNYDGDVIAFESTCNALTGAATNKKIVVWNGTTVTNFMGTAACTAGDPKLNRSATALIDDRYIVFESTCVLNGANADGNNEIYRYDRTAATYLRITNTTTNSTGGATQNTAPVVDATGTIIYFISDGNLTPTGTPINSDNSFEVFRYLTATSNLTQRTNSTDAAYLTVRTSSAGADYGFERFSFLTFKSTVGHRKINNTVGAADPEDIIATGDSPTGIDFGMNGVIPILGFLAGDDFLGTNADKNVELWQGRVQ